MDLNSFLLGVPVGLALAIFYRGLKRASRRRLAFRLDQRVVDVKKAQSLVEQGWQLFLLNDVWFYPAVFVPPSAIEAGITDWLANGQQLNRIRLTEKSARILFPKVTIHRITEFM